MAAGVLGHRNKPLLPGAVSSTQLHTPDSTAATLQGAALDVSPEKIFQIVASCAATGHGSWWLCEVLRVKERIALHTKSSLSHHIRLYAHGCAAHTWGTLRRDKLIQPLIWFLLGQLVHANFGFLRAKEVIKGRHIGRSLLSLLHSSRRNTQRAVT